MKTMLQSLNAVPGVIGGFISNNNGGVLAHSFSSNYDLATLQEISSELGDHHIGLHEATGGITLLDLRYERFRVIVKSFPDHFLLVLCNQNINLQLLSLSMNVAIRKIEKILSYTPNILPLVVEPDPSPQPLPLTVAPLQQRTNCGDDDRSYALILAG